MLTLLSQSVIDIHRAVKILSHLICTLTAEVEQGNTLLSSFFAPTPTANKCPFRVHSVPCFHIFLPFCCPFHSLKWPQKCSAEALSHVPKSDEAVMPLSTEKILVLFKLCLSMSWSAVGVCAKLINQWYMFNKVPFNRHTHKTRLYIDQLAKVVTTGSQNPNSVFLIETII